MFSKVNDRQDYWARELIIWNSKLNHSDIHYSFTLVSLMKAKEVLSTYWSCYCLHDFIIYLKAKLIFSDFGLLNQALVCIYLMSWSGSIGLPLLDAT